MPFEVVNLNYRYPMHGSIPSRAIYDDMAVQPIVIGPPTKIKRRQNSQKKKPQKQQVKLQPKKQQTKKVQTSQPKNPTPVEIDYTPQVNDILKNYYGWTDDELSKMWITTATNPITQLRNNSFLPPPIDVSLNYSDYNQRLAEQKLNEKNHVEELLKAGWTIQDGDEVEYPTLWHGSQTFRPKMLVSKDGTQSETLKSTNDFYNEWQSKNENQFQQRLRYSLQHPFENALANAHKDAVNSEYKKALELSGLEDTPSIPITADHQFAGLMPLPKLDENNPIVQSTYDLNRFKRQMKDLVERGWKVNTENNRFTPGFGTMEIAESWDNVLKSPDGSESIYLSSDNNIPDNMQSRRDPADNIANDAMFALATGGIGLANGALAETGAAVNTAGQWLLNNPFYRDIAKEMIALTALDATAQTLYNYDWNSKQFVNRNWYWDDFLNLLGTDKISNPYLQGGARFVGSFLNPIFMPTLFTNTALKAPAFLRNSFGKYATNPYKGIRIGNYYYKPDMNTLSSGLPGIKRTPVENSAWQMESLPGLQIKSLKTNGPLEKQLSKNGTISINQLQAYINRNDVSAIDKQLIGKVLENHVGETHLDYNVLRREVQEMIPKYEKVPQTNWATYGTKGLGLSEEATPSRASDKLFTRKWNGRELVSRRRRYPGDQIGGEIVPGEQVREEALAYMREHPEEFYQFNTFTFESPGIKGNTKHYPGQPLGHSRTYSSPEEPNVLHVMESQSDWAQSRRNPKLEKEIEEAQFDLDSEIFDESPHYNDKESLLTYLADLRSQLNTSDPILARMRGTYTQRHIQENLRHAAENGQTKMRYPTPETAAKIEGYRKLSVSTRYQQLYVEDQKLRADYISDKIDKDIYFNKHQKLQEEMIKALQEPGGYSLEHHTILKKYAQFPKQYEKLFGKGTVREVTDAKGNTWYEVDVPESYLNGNAEILFRKGGAIVSSKQKQLYKKGGIIPDKPKHK